jgi:hypothetical protein
MFKIFYTVRTKTNALGQILATTNIYTLINFAINYQMLAKHRHDWWRYICWCQLHQNTLCLHLFYVFYAVLCKTDVCLQGGHCSLSITWHSQDIKNIHIDVFLDFSDKCKNVFPSACEDWAQKGFCLTFNELMKRYCRKACRLCGELDLLKLS